MNNSNLLIGLVLGVILGNDKTRQATLDITNKLANSLTSEISSGTITKKATDTVKKINETISSDKQESD